MPTGFKLEYLICVLQLTASVASYSLLAFVPLFLRRNMQMQVLLANIQGFALWCISVVLTSYNRKVFVT